MHQVLPLNHLRSVRFETAPILRKLTSSSRQLAELKGIAASIPNQSILINTLGLQEAKDSSAIENIVTTHDDLFKGGLQPLPGNSAAKEVLRYREALLAGFGQVQASGLLTLNDILRIQEVLEENRAGFRKLPGTTLKDGTGQTVYMPPQDPDEVLGA
jgi:Fic family protein